MEKIIFLIRHTEPVLEDKQRRYLGQSDPDLSIAGRQQAEQLACNMQDQNIRCVYSSDLKRAAQTALLIAQRCQLQPIFLTALREINMGTWEGKSFQEIRECDPDGFAARGKDIVKYRPPEGESFLDVQERVLPIFNEIIEKSDGNIAIVAHGGVNRVILSSLMNIPLDNLFSIRQNYGAVNIIRKKSRTLTVFGINKNLNCF
ncbi:MAG: histidine phosphatase family protein [Clostridiaceae bacterium]|nr:histidine phosphatase family protein [Clostridiaceae bacterium]